MKDYFRCFTTDNLLHLSQSDFQALLTTFTIYPDLLKKSDLDILYDQLCNFQPTFDLNLLTQSLALIALNHYPNNYTNE